jgi:flavorubredoxin
VNTHIPIAEGVYWVGVNDRSTHLFESLWPLPHGVSYNAYLIDDEKVALVDAVKDLFAGDLAGNLRTALGAERGVDYLVVNHIEPDHSGAIQLLRQLFPRMQIVGNKKTAEFLEHLHGITDNVRVVTDGDELDLGRRKLRFHITPMVHWPETMMTYLTGDGVLFSGDAFGGYATLERGIFDDQLPNVEVYEGESLRYYSNIVGRVSPMVQKALQKLAGLDLRMIAPTHGLVWRGNPRRIVHLYDRWSTYQAEEAVVLVYASMYGNTESTMEAVAQALTRAGVNDLRVHDVSVSHLSYVIRDLWRARGAVIGTPTYELGVFPLISNLLHLLDEKRLTHRVAGIFGTYGWSGGGVKGVRAAMERLGWEIVEPVVEARFSPKAEHREQIEQMARALAARVRDG